MYLRSNALCRAQLSVFSKGIKDIATRDPGWRVFLVPKIGLGFPSDI